MPIYLNRDFFSSSPFLIHLCTFIPSKFYQTYLHNYFLDSPSLTYSLGRNNITRLNAQQDPPPIAPVSELQKKTFLQEMSLNSMIRSYRSTFRFNVILHIIDIFPDNTTYFKNDFIIISTPTDLYNQMGTVSKLTLFKTL